MGFIRLCLIRKEESVSMDEGPSTCSASASLCAFIFLKIWNYPFCFHLSHSSTCC